MCLAILVTPALASGPVMSPAAAPAAETPSVTAMGIGVAQSSAMDPLAIGQTLYISAQSTADSAGVQSAADELIARLDAIKAALVKAGVPADGVRVTGLSVNPNVGPSKPGGPAQPVASVSLTGSLSADVPSIRMLVAAMNAATENGATQVNANAGKGGTPYGTVQPSAADLTKATQAAVANARTNAEALAAASGKRLGAIRSISSSQPPMMGCCPPNAAWTVQVTVTFDFAP
ncbi:MAG: SIMPL domain-containing protein [Chloroflexota bacterium]|nr:SIMPL domain-containing protein [Chloroflexota bacterium]